ncbi:CIA30 family protein [Shewanella pneumatophori]|uniref:CIA30 family protein n=1 Tax=Shewanella pneumatophori TaxID=314092 RepID=A0A9X1ZDU0_9GAMM|nr:CIA30 family protein [Shewanella pneumatophori]MCL1139736.1 CIA30 family protein [Shewanella pneumatophori]
MMTHSPNLVKRLSHALLSAFAFAIIINFSMSILIMPLNHQAIAQQFADNQSQSNTHSLIIATLDWRTINDTVMGGISASQVTLYNSTDNSADSNDNNSANNNVARFYGNLSLEQNGGFASTRASISEPLAKNINMIRLQVKGDGRDYQLRLRTDNQWDSYAYSASFSTQKDSWINIEFRPNDFTAVYRGRRVNAPELNFENVKQLGFLLADKQAGTFELSFKDINFIFAD